MIAPPWEGIDPDLLVSGHLTLRDLARYWTIPEADVGTEDPCCNCERVMRIHAAGLCQACHDAARGKTGTALLNALTMQRAKLMQVEPISMGKGDTGLCYQPEVEMFERPRVVGKIPLPPPEPRKQPRKNKEDKLSACIHAVDEAGNDLGPLADYAAGLCLDQPDPQRGGRAAPDAPLRPIPPGQPVVKRSLVVEFGGAEMEFRVGGALIDIRVESAGEIVFHAKGVELAFIKELALLLGGQERRNE